MVMKKEKLRVVEQSTHSNDLFIPNEDSGSLFIHHLCTNQTVQANRNPGGEDSQQQLLKTQSRKTGNV